MKKTIFKAVLLSVILALAIVSCVTSPQDDPLSGTAGSKGSPRSKGSPHSEEPSLSQQLLEEQRQEEAQRQQEAQQHEEKYASIPAEPENSFAFELTSDGRGIKITRYTGTTKALRIPSNIQDLPVLEINGFTGNTAITSVVLPPGITTIGEKLFQGCTSLTSIVIPENVTFIGAEAFKDCVNLASVNRFPDRIGASAFQGCRSLTGTIDLSSDKNNIGNNAFAGTGYSAVRLSLLGDLGRSVFADCLNLQEVTIIRIRVDNRGNPITEIPAGMFSGCTALTYINLGRIREISARAFSDCTSLTDITLSASVTSIDDNAFAGCFSLTTVTIPESVTRIRFGRNSFSGCSSLPIRTQARLKQLGYGDGF